MDDFPLEEFEEETGWLFNPEPDEDGLPPIMDYPNARLSKQFNLDFSYMQDSNYEGSSGHKYTRIKPVGEERISVLTRNLDVPDRLFKAALQLFADSIIAYHKNDKKEGELKFYPPILLTFWAGFEAFVRHSSHLLIVTAKSLPDEVKNYLSEEEKYIDSKRLVAARDRYYGILDRYAVFLKYAYNYEVNRGDNYWQNLVKAKELRDYYTHIDISEPRRVSSADVLSFIEAILLSIIMPSSKLQRTLMMGVYWLYEIWTTLHKYNFDYSERPFFLDWHLMDQYLFHCNFENIDSERFPSMDQELKNRQK